MAANRPTTPILATDNDRGDIVGWALILPLLLMITIGAVQIAMWYQARNLCQAAAQAGIRQARLLVATPGSGATAASSYLDTVSGGSVTDAHLHETRTRTSVTVSCTGHALRVLPLPGLSIAVRQSATAPRERFTTVGNP